MLTSYHQYIFPFDNDSDEVITGGGHLLGLAEALASIGGHQFLIEEKAE
jgi:hypothetical protein